MDGQLRAFVWANAMAAAIGTNHPADQAAQTADKAVAEFDKRTFNDRENEQVEYLTGQIAEREATIVRLEGERNELQATIDKDTEALLAAQATPSLDLTLGMELAAEVAQPDFLEKYNALKTKAAAFDALGAAPAAPPESTDEL